MRAISPVHVPRIQSQVGQVGQPDQAAAVVIALVVAATKAILFRNRA